MNSNTAIITKRILKLEAGSIITANDLLTFGSRDLADQVLVRLQKKGILRRISRGLYEKPKTNKIIGSLSPDPIKMAQSWAKVRGAKLLPSGAYAAYLLGLIQQIPTTLEFITDASNKSFESGNLRVLLKSASSKKLKNAERISGLIFQGFRFLGQTRITNESIAILKKSITNDNRQSILNDLKYAPKWMHRYILAVCEVTES